MVDQYDLIVIGAGPGGYVAAIRGAQLGMSVACIEKEAELGGTCLRVGCIPSKALLEASEHYHTTKTGLSRFGVSANGVELDLPAMLGHKDSVVHSLTQGVGYLLKKNKIKRYLGVGRFVQAGRIVVEGSEGSTELSYRNAIVATGSVPMTLPGVELDGVRIGSSTDALSYSAVPEHLIVIGAGYIGLELGSVWSRLGARVTVVEYLDRILPGMDADTANEALRIFKKQGLNFRLGARVTSVTSEADTCTVAIDGSEPLRGDRVLVAVGRRPSTDGVGLDAVGVQLDERGRIQVDERFQTSCPGVYAIGDVIAGPMLAHKAEDEGMACVDGIAGRYCHVGYDAIAGIVYTNPEIATVGKTEEQLKAAGIPFKRAVFPFAANGRAKAIGQVDGRVKMLAHAETDLVLGVHIIGPHAGDLIAEAAMAIEFSATAEDVARTSHAHPTLSECMREAALALGDGAIHL